MYIELAACICVPTSATYSCDDADALTHEPLLIKGTTTFTSLGADSGTTCNINWFSIWFHDVFTSMFLTITHDYMSKPVSIL